MLNGSQRAVLPQLHRLLTVSLAGGATDRQLVEEFLNRRDPAAFAALVRRHGPMVLRVCRRVLHNVHDAEDAFQATFLVLVRKARSIAKQEAVGSWLYGVAHRVALRARVDAARRRKHERQAGERMTDHTRDATSHDARPILDEEVNRLPEKYRQPILLCYFEGKTYEEAARLLGWPAGTVSVRLARARNLLGGRLARRGITVASAALAALLAEGAASATVPPILVETTVQTVLRFVVDAAAAGVSAQVLALTEGVVQTMMLRKLKMLAGIMLAVGLLGGGAGILGRFTATEPAAAAQSRQPDKIRGEDEASRRQTPDAPGPRPLAPPANGARPPQSRIGLINMKRVLKASKKYQAVEIEIRARARAVEEEVKKLKRDFQNAAVDSNDREEQQRVAKRMRQLQAEIEEKSTAVKRLIADRTADAIATMYRDIEDAARKVANRDGIELVMFYTDAVTAADFYNPANVQRKLTQPGALMPLVVAPGMDITEMVVEVLNKSAGR